MPLVVLATRLWLASGVLMGPWVVLHIVQGSDILHSYPVKTIYGPIADETIADALREHLERPLEGMKETIVECWPLTSPPKE